MPAVLFVPVLFVPPDGQLPCRTSSQSLLLWDPCSTFFGNFRLDPPKPSSQHMMMLILWLFHHWAIHRAMDCVSGQSTSRALAGSWPEMQSMLLWDFNLPAIASMLVIAHLKHFQSMPSAAVEFWMTCTKVFLLFLLGGFQASNARKLICPAFVRPPPVVL